MDMLLREERVFDIILPRLIKRFVHVENGDLTKRVSLIDDDLLEEEEDAQKIDEKSDSENDVRDTREDYHHSRRRSRSRSVEKSRSERSRHSRREDGYSSKHRRSRSRSVERHSRRSPSPKRSKHKRERGKSDRKKPDEATSEQDEIAQMNALRASLGLKPLK